MEDRCSPFHAAEFHKTHKVGIVLKTLQNHALANTCFLRAPPPKIKKMYASAGGASEKVWDFSAKNPEKTPKNYSKIEKLTSPRSESGCGGGGQRKC